MGKEKRGGLSERIRSWAVVKGDETLERERDIPFS